MTTEPGHPCPQCGEADWHWTAGNPAVQRCHNCGFTPPREFGQGAGAVFICSECGHASNAHGAEGCEAKNWACPCPLLPRDILPMTPEGQVEFDRNRYRGRT